MHSGPLSDSSCHKLRREPPREGRGPRHNNAIHCGVDDILPLHVNQDGVFTAERRSPASIGRGDIFHLVPQPMYDTYIIAMLSSVYTKTNISFDEYGYCWPCHIYQICSCRDVSLPFDFGVIR